MDPAKPPRQNGAEYFKKRRKERVGGRPVDGVEVPPYEHFFGGVASGPTAPPPSSSSQQQRPAQAAEGALNAEGRHRGESGKGAKSGRENFAGPRGGEEEFQEILASARAYRENYLSKGSKKNHDRPRTAPSGDAAACAASVSQGRKESGLAGSGSTDGAEGGGGNNPAAGATTKKWTKRRDKRKERRAHEMNGASAAAAGIAGVVGSESASDDGNKRKDDDGLEAAMELLRMSSSSSSSKPIGAVIIGDISTPLSKTLSLVSSASEKRSGGSQPLPVAAAAAASVEAAASDAQPQKISNRQKKREKRQMRREKKLAATAGDDSGALSSAAEVIARASDSAEATFPMSSDDKRDDIEKRTRECLASLAKGGNEAATAKNSLPALLRRLWLNEKVDRTVVASLILDATEFLDYFNKRTQLDYCKFVEESQNMLKTEYNASPASLQLEIDFLISQIRHTEEDLHHRSEFVKLIVQHAAYLDPPCAVSLFGSAACGFGHKSSDIDIGLNPGPAFDGDEALTEHLLKQLTKRLRREYRVSSVMPILHSRVPIVKAKHRLFGLECDIGRESFFSRHKSALLNVYSEIDPRVRSLVCLVKHWAKRRGVNDASTGSMNSFGYTLLCIFLLQAGVTPPILPCLQHEEIVTPQGQRIVIPPGGEPRYHTFSAAFRNFGAGNTMNVAQLFFRFFEFYTLHVDFGESCVSIRAGQLLRKSDCLFQHRQRRNICVEDPFDSTDNVTRSIEEGTAQRILLEMRRAAHLICRGSKLGIICAADRPQFEDHAQPPFGAAGGGAAAGGGGGGGGFYRGARPFSRGGRGGGYGGRGRGFG